MPINFAQDFPAYAVGRRANMEEWNTITRTNSGATAIPFGVPVVRGATTHSVVILTATAQAIIGISEASVVHPHVGDNHAQYDNVPVCTMGVIGVELGSDVVENAQARFNLSTGKWTSAAQSATVATIPGAQFAADGANGAVGVVRYVRPAPSVSVAS